MSLPAIFTLPAPSRAASVHEGETTRLATTPQPTPQSTLFADVLNPDSAASGAVPRLSEDTQDSLPAIAIALTPAEEPTTGTDADLPEDLPWPPEGLASLWPPAPEPAPPLYSTAMPAPSATGTHARAITSASPEAARPPEILQTPDTPATASLQPASALPATPGALPTPAPSTRPTSIPGIPATPEPAPPPVPAEDLKPLAPLPEQGPAESAPAPASQAGFTLSDPQPAPAIIPPSPAPFPLAPAQPSPTPATSPAPFPAPELHADTFPDTVGSHIQWLAEHKIGHALLHLTPQDMGPLEVHLKLDGDQLQAHFTSAEPDVRQTLESALPRLRELLGEHGLNLAQSSIGQHASHQQRPSTPSPERGFIADAADEDAPPSSAIATPTAAALNLLDAYA